MEINRSKYENLTDKPFDEHINNMKNNEGGQEIWGTDVEITAAANYLGVDFEVHSLCRGTPQVQLFKQQLLGHYSATHFDL